MTTTTKTYSGSTHSGYVITNDFGAIVATVIASRRRVANAGFFVRLYTAPDEYNLLHVTSILDAKMLATDHAEAIR